MQLNPEYKKVFDSDSISDYQDLICEKDYPLLQFVRILK